MRRSPRRLRRDRRGSQHGERVVGGDEGEGPESSVQRTLRFPIQQAVECMLLSFSVAASANDAEAGARFRRQANDSLSSYLCQVLEGFRRQMTTGVTNLNIPVLDPLQAADFNLDEDTGLNNYRAIFWDIRITGLRNFVVRNLRVDLEALRLDLTLEVPNAHVEGQYELDGRAVGILPLSGKGSFWVLAIHLVASGFALLRINSHDHLDLQNLNLDLDVRDIELNFDNLLGGGAIGEVANNVASALSKGTFDRIKPRILANLESAIRNKLNDELRHFDAIRLIYGGFHCPMEQHKSDANMYMDQVLEKARDQIKQSGLDPLTLPDTDMLSEGQLMGLSTVYRSGDGDLGFSTQAVTLEAHLGFADLRATYKWSKKVLLHLSGRIGARVRDVSIFIRIRQPTTPGSNPVMETFEIQHLGRISMDLSGLGPISWVVKKVASLVSNMMRRRIAERLEGPVRQIIESNLHSARGANEPCLCSHRTRMTFDGVTVMESLTQFFRWSPSTNETIRIRPRGRRIGFLSSFASARRNVDTEQTTRLRISINTSHTLTNVVSCEF